MCTRPRANTDIAARNPVSTSPLTRASGPTCTPSKVTSDDVAPAWPIFWSFGPMMTPAVVVGTRKTAIRPSDSGTPRTFAKVTSRSDRGALVM